MINLKISKHKVKMANKVSEISLEKGIQIMSVIGDKEPNIVDKISIISLLSNLDVDVIMLFTDESIEEIYSKIEFTNKKPFSIRIPKVFKLKGTTYGLKNFEELTLKEYAEIEFYLDKGEDIYVHLGEILAVLYRPIKSRNLSVGNILFNIIFQLRYKIVKPKIYRRYVIEDLNDSHEENTPIFLKYCDFELGYGILNEFFKFKQQLKDSYDMLFKTDTQLENEQTDDFKPNEDEKDFQEIWGYYFIVNEISQNIFERDAWWEKPVKEFFKYLSFKKQKTLYEIRNGRRE